MKFQKRLTAKVQPSVIEANGKKNLISFTQHTKNGIKLEIEKNTKNLLSPKITHPNCRNEDNKVTHINSDINL